MTEKIATAEIDCPRCKENPGQIIHVWWDSEEEANSLDRFGVYAHFDSYWCGLCEGTALVEIDNDAICEKCKGTKTEVDEDGDEVDCSECEGYGYYPDCVGGDVLVDTDEDKG